MTDRRRVERFMSEADRNQWCIALRRAGWGWAKIGAYVGLSANGARYLHQRLTDPEAYYADA